MIAAIDRAREAGDTLGGAFEVIATDVPLGLGSYAQWDRKLDGRLAQALMSIPAIKAVGVGIGAEAAQRPGSRVHDEIIRDDSSPRAAPAWRGPPTTPAASRAASPTAKTCACRGYMKPISTLMKPLRSVDLTTMTESPAAIERSDVCAVPAAAVVGEAMVAFVLADALLERFGGDSMAAIARAMSAADAVLAVAFQRSMIRPILRYGERQLHARAEAVSRFDAALHRVVDDMIDTMYAAPGHRPRRNRRSASRCESSSSTSPSGGPPAS